MPCYSIRLQRTPTSRLESFWRASPSFRRPRLLQQLDDFGVACLRRHRQGGYTYLSFRAHICTRI